ncbi:single-stranded DNA-binding protein [Ligilactobacillus faecis]|uniref:Single-stranded DNA-binding protein n=1 Tax=Ligilactobacillus faecis TaxID=762833 RepID=A0ABV4DM53_9LACO
MLNIVAVNGRLTTDIRVSVVRDTKMANFVVAVQKNYKGRDGKYGTSFFPVVLWGAAVEYLEKYSSKGTLVSISGELNGGIRQKEDGTPENYIEILANNVNILEYKKRENHSATAINTADSQQKSETTHKETTQATPISKHSNTKEQTPHISQHNDEDTFEPVDQGVKLYDPFDI